MVRVIGLPDRGSRESRVLQIVGLEVLEEKKTAPGDDTELLRHLLSVNKIIMVEIENKKVRGDDGGKEGHTGQVL